MSYTVTKFVLDLYGLTTTEKAVAHSLAYHAHPDGSEAYPSMDTIAEEAGIQGKYRRRTAQRIVRQLEKKGVIVAESRKIGGRSKSTHYRFNLNCDLGVALSVEEETATSGVGNCDIRGQKLRPGCRTKDQERKERQGGGRQASTLPREGFKEYWIRQPGESDDDYSYRQIVEEQLDEEEEMLSSIPPALTQWVSSLRPFPVQLTEADASQAFKTVNDLLFNGAAILFGTKRGECATLQSYERIWRLDERYGAGTSGSLAKKILEVGVASDEDPYPVSHRSFIWNHLADELVEASSARL